MCEKKKIKVEYLKKNRAELFSLSNKTDLILFIKAQI